MSPRPVGVAMSDGSVRPFEEILGGITELSERSGASKGAVASWWSRSRRAETANPFPAPLFRLSVGPIWFVPDIDDYRPGVGRWPQKNQVESDVSRG